jgi:amino acid transporter
MVAANAVSSVAYASEEILIALRLDGESFSNYYLMVITLAIVTLMLLVVLTYDYVIRAYPGGGGAYTVAKENLGTTPALVAAASLLVEYALTVSVSVTAGTAALVSAFPLLNEFRIALALLLVAALTLVNLRGVRHSAELLAPPVYLFIGSLILMIVIGMYRYVVDGPPSPPVPSVSQLDLNSDLTFLGFLVLLRAFASGCVAFTGVEAISNSLSIFRPPEARNARIALALMGLLLAMLFIGVSLLAYLFQIGPVPGETLVSLSPISVY